MCSAASSQSAAGTLHQSTCQTDHHRALLFQTVQQPTFGFDGGSDGTREAETVRVLRPNKEHV